MANASSKSIVALLLCVTIGFVEANWIIRAFDQVSENWYRALCFIIIPLIFPVQLLAISVVWWERPRDRPMRVAAAATAFAPLGIFLLMLIRSNVSP